MHQFDPSVLRNLYFPPSSSHKGQNGKVLLIGGSKLFHSASLWALEIASKIVDMVYYCSVPENNELVLSQKKAFRNGIIIPRHRLDDYIHEADCVLIGPGLPREKGLEKGDDNTQELTKKLLARYPEKKWVIDGGSIQVIQPEMLPKNCIITPHHREFEMIKLKIKNEKLKIEMQNSKVEEQVELFAKEYTCIVLLKGEVDFVCSPHECVKIPGGNSGMTKGGTGDVLAGLTAALYAKNEAFLSACAASYVNKKAGESLFEQVGYYFNASDLVEEIPKVMKQAFLDTE